MKDSLGKTGNAPIKKVGHTFSGSHGSNPMAQVKGVTTTPSEITFGSGGSK
jgi:hypothetical protein